MSLFACIAAALHLSSFFSLASAAEPDHAWPANAVVAKPERWSDPSLGAAQGATVFNEHLYIYGDVYNVEPRNGIIREYGLDFRPSGRVVWLQRHGTPLITHPTGLTFDPKWGTLLGNTVDQKGSIFRLDWDQMWKDGNLDHALREVWQDDAAVNGTRPLFVKVKGIVRLATADYGANAPALRIYDLDALKKTKHSRGPGALLHTIPVRGFNQNLDWNEKTGEVTCIQNVRAGRGWQLDILSLEKAIALGGSEIPGVRTQRLVFPPHDELEGFARLPDGRHLFITSSQGGNLTTGFPREIAWRTSRKGTTQVNFEPGPHPKPHLVIPVPPPSASSCFAPVSGK